MEVTEKIKLHRMVLNLVGIAVNDKTTDLMLRAIEEVKNQGDQLTLKDGSRILAQWGKDWKTKEEKP